MNMIKKIGLFLRKIFFKTKKKEMARFSTRTYKLAIKEFVTKEVLPCLNVLNEGEKIGVLNKTARLLYGINTINGKCDTQKPYTENSSLKKICFQKKEDVFMLEIYKKKGYVVLKNIYKYEQQNKN